LNLSLENKDSVFDVQVSGNLFGLLRSGGDVTSLDEDAELAHEIFALIFVEVEKSSDRGGERL